MLMEQGYIRYIDQNSDRRYNFVAWGRPVPHVELIHDVTSRSHVLTKLYLSKIPYVSSSQSNRHTIIAIVVSGSST